LDPSGKAERKYLDRHAEPEAIVADGLGAFGHALVVPACGEGEMLVEMLRSVPRGALGDVLVVLVVNGKKTSAAWVHEENRAVLGRLRRAFGDGRVEVVSRDPPTHLLAFDRGRILVLDRSGPEHLFPGDQGVGLARKIGGDLAARLYASGRLASPFVHSTDADVVLPEDYFERAAASPQAAALLYPFCHVPEADPALARAVLLYEISLRYYVLGLAFAGSPWAYHTIGSTIATRAGAYVRVRGFPKRDAGEDFYLLSKLAKIGSVVSLSGRPISIRGRASDRVPFGTGAAVRRLSAAGAPPFTLYEPRLFLYLRAWLGVLGDSAARFSERDLDRGIGDACAKDSLDPAPLVAALAVLGAHASVASARRRSTSIEALRRHLATWFDAFRTLKLLHTLQRADIAPRPWADALREAPFTGELPAPEGSENLDHLRMLSERLASMEPR
jgi:hypothetical protein